MKKTVAAICALLALGAEAQTSPAPIYVPPSTVSQFSKTQVSFSSSGNAAW